ncbi:MAG: fibronectin type III domain-containing protein [Flavobacteriales bacterium]|nr:fibronectin type III domain-containing protein [Flavobacteriales bacterium]MCC6939830.1 fibronectin type III domain-containing protein [Flavobacteriales bacterium]
MRLIKTDLRGLNALAVLNRARLIHAAMNGNPAFPSPLPSMADFGAACDALKQSTLRTLNGGSRLDYCIKQERFITVKEMIKALAGYVNAVAQGNTAIVYSAGFTERDPSKRITALKDPEHVRARTGSRHGTIIVRWPPVRGARMYQLYIRRADVHEGELWQPLTLTSNSRYEATGLDPLTYYSFKLCAIGTSTRSGMSSAVTALSIGRKAA